MRNGVGYPSYGAEAPWVAAVGSWDANYPQTNLSDLIRTSKVARAGGTSQREVSAILPVARTLQMVAFVGHNITNATAAFRIYAFSGTGNDPVANAGTIVADSGVQLFWPSSSVAVAGYRSNRPYIFSAPFTARSFYIAIAGVDVASEIEAIELAGFWEWPGIGYGRSLGFTPSDQSYVMAGGASGADDGYAPLAVSGQIPFLQLGAAVNLAYDFQAWADMNNPFLFIEDYDTPSSWPRTCFWARNSALKTINGAVYRHDRFTFDFGEHRR